MSDKHSMHQNVYRNVVTGATPNPVASSPKRMKALHQFWNVRNLQKNALAG